MNPVAILAAALGLAACVTDLRTRQIPNWIPAAALVGGVAIHGWLGGWRGAVMSLLAAACGFLAFLIFYLLGGMGGGDVKLTAGFGAVLGWPAVLQGSVVYCNRWRSGRDGHRNLAVDSHQRPHRRAGCGTRLDSLCAGHRRRRLDHIMGSLMKTQTQVGNGRRRACSGMEAGLRIRRQ